MIDHWALLFLCAQRLGLELEVFPGCSSLMPGGEATPLDMHRLPTNDELLELVHAGSRIPLAEIKRHPHGAYFPDPPVYVQPKQDGWEGRLDVANADMTDDLSTISRFDDLGEDFPFRLISRRMMHVLNSPSIAMPANRAQFNPAFMCPADLAALGLSSGEVASIQSSRASVLAIVQADVTVRRGVVSMSHCFGDVPGSELDVPEVGTSTARLIANDDRFDRYTATAAHEQCGGTGRALDQRSGGRRLSVTHPLSTSRICPGTTTQWCDAR